jgi:CubicO group peptidase (beta-lactamase class C family)
MADRSLDDPFSNREVFELIARQKRLNFKPGEKSLYSNSNYVLLAEIVRRVSGRSLREFADENIFRPLGMANTQFKDDRTAVVKNRVISYTPISGGGFRQFVDTTETIGAGNMLTTIEDLARWDQNFYDHKVGGEIFGQQILTRTKLNSGEERPYGFAMLNEEYRGSKAASHEGAFLGFRTEMVRFPEYRFTVICLCNVSVVNPRDLAKQVADLYLADQLKPAVPVSHKRPAPKFQQPQALTPEQLNEYAGDYYSEELDVRYQIVVENGKLLIKVKNAPRGSLASQSKDEFGLFGATFSFLRNDQRQITGFELSGGRAMGIQFVRKAN